MRTTALFLAIYLLLSGTELRAQYDDLLPVDVSVTVNDRATGQFTVTLYRDNEEVLQLQPSKYSGFKLALEYGVQYSVVIHKDGFHEKWISVNTERPDGGGQAEPYLCELQLRPLNSPLPTDPFYIDFPSALVRWYGKKRGFDHSAHYAQDIQAATAPASNAERMVSADRSRPLHVLNAGASGR